MMKKIFKWLDNYWYHYKWQTIIGAAFAVIIAILAVQMFTKEESDFSVIYAGPVTPTPNQTREMENAFADMLTDDKNDDGKRNATMMNFFLLTDEQKEKQQKEAEEQGRNMAVVESEMIRTRQSFTTHVTTGETMICLLDPAWYEMLREQNAFAELSKITDNVPDYAVDEYAVRLCDTPFAKYYTAFGVLPEDTLLCFRRVSTVSSIGKKENERKYSENKEIFKAILEYK